MCVCVCATLVNPVFVCLPHKSRVYAHSREPSDCATARTHARTHISPDARTHISPDHVSAVTHSTFPWDWQIAFDILSRIINTQIHLK